MEAKEKEEKKEVRESIDQATDMAKAKNHIDHNRSTRKINKLWLWLGVLVLCILLVWWIFSIGTAEDLPGVINGN